MWCALAQTNRRSNIPTSAEPLPNLRRTRKVPGVRIANEILMYFRAGRKRAQDVSLSELIATGSDGAALEIMDVVAGEEDLLEELHARENARLLRRLVQSCLTDQEREVICLRYGLFGHAPRRQREVASQLGISRSYVSRIEKRALERLRGAFGQER